MALTQLTKVDGGGISTTSDYRVGIITASKFVGPFDGTGGNFSGVVTATSANFTGNVTIGGTLTYEDVTNIDSVGIITAQKDIHVGAGVSVVGIVTAATFKGDGDFVDIDVDGHTNLDNVSVAGVTTFANKVTAAAGANKGIQVGSNLKLTDQANVFIQNTANSTMYLMSKGTQIRDRSNNNIASFSETAGSSLFHHSGSTKKLGTSATGINILEDLDVDGHTNLDNVSVAGVSTFADRITISGGKDLFMFDNGVIRLGNDSNTVDFQMWHDGGHTRLNNATGSLYINNSSTNGSIRLNPKDGESGLIVRYDGPVELFYDNTLRFSTSGVGATVYGNLDVTADIDVDGHTNLDNVSVAGITTHNEDVRFITANGGNILIDKSDNSIRLGQSVGLFYGTNKMWMQHNGSVGYLHNVTGSLYIRNEDSSGDIYIQGKSGEHSIICNYDGSVELYWDGAKKFETGNTVNINSNHFEITSGQQLRFDNSNNNRTSEILNDGSSGNSVITFKTNGGNRWTIDSSGHFLPGTAGAVNIGSASAEIGDVYIADDKKLYLGSSQDVEIYHSSGNVTLFNSPTNRQVQLKGDGGLLIRASGNQNIANFLQSGVTLYHSVGNSYTARFVTTSTGITVTGEVEASQDYPNFRPTLDFNFAATKKLDSRISFARQGTASYYDEFGKVKFAADNEPRFDHDPDTGECKGLLIEQDSINLIAGSADEGSDTRSVYSTLGNGFAINELVADVIRPTGTPGLVRRVKSHASSNSGGRWGGYSGSGGSPYAGSFWARSVTGTSQVGIDVNDTGYNVTTLTTEWVRVKAEGTTSNNYDFMDITLPNTSDDIYIWGMQLEQNEYASSYIRNGKNSSQAYRGADIVKIDGEEFSEFYNPIESTILVDYTHDITSSQLGTNQRLYRFRAVGGSDTRIDYVSNSGYNPYIAKDGSAVASISHGQPTQFGSTGVNRSAVRVKENSFAVSFNGSTIVEDTSGAWNPTNAITEVTLGSSNGGSALNGYIRRFVYYSTGLPNSQLVTLTS